MLGWLYKQCMPKTDLLRKGLFQAGAMGETLVDLGLFNLFSRISGTGFHATNNNKF